MPLDQERTFISQTIQTKVIITEIIETSEPAIFNLKESKNKTFPTLSKGFVMKVIFKPDKITGMTETNNNNNRKTGFSSNLKWEFTWVF